MLSSSMEIFVKTLAIRFSSAYYGHKHNMVFCIFVELRFEFFQTPRSIEV